MALLAICGALGAPAGVLVAALLIGAVVAAAAWLRTSIQFTASDLAVTMLLRPRRITWVHVHGVTLQDIHDSDSDEVTHQRAVIHYRRDPGSPLPPMPTVFGEYRTWARTHPANKRVPRGSRLPRGSSSSSRTPRLGSPSAHGRRLGDQPVPSDKPIHPH